MVFAFLPFPPGFLLFFVFGAPFPPLQTRSSSFYRQTTATVYICRQEGKWKDNSQQGV